MKKIFLVFGIAAFSSTSAQQQETFDIQQHLLKKNKESSPQNVFTFPQPGNNLFATPSTPGMTPALPFYTLENGDRVYTLSQDNMPCVVPDMRQFNRSNVSTQSEYFDLLANQRMPGVIPNAITPRRIISSK